MFYFFLVEHRPARLILHEDCNLRDAEQHRAPEEREHRPDDPHAQFCPRRLRDRRQLRDAVRSHVERLINHCRIFCTRRPNCIGTECGGVRNPSVDTVIGGDKPRARRAAAQVACSEKSRRRQLSPQARSGPQAIA